MAGTTSNVQIDSNTITWNGDAWFYAHNKSIFTEGWDPRDITIESSTSDISQANNTISPQLDKVAARVAMTAARAAMTHGRKSSCIWT
jgi:hypothetical protein